MLFVLSQLIPTLKRIIEVLRKMSLVVAVTKISMHFLFSYPDILLQVIANQ
jgi:hypothetical protein